MLFFVVDEIKNLGNTDAVEKSRFSMKSFSNSSHNYMTYATTVQRISQRINLCITPCLEDLIMFLRVITQAYTQTQRNITPNIYFEPPPGTNLEYEKILKVIRSLYGLPKSSLFWSET